MGMIMGATMRAASLPSARVASPFMRAARPAFRMGITRGGCTESNLHFPSPLLMRSTSFSFHTTRAHTRSFTTDGGPEIIVEPYPWTEVKDPAGWTYWWCEETDEVTEVGAVRPREWTK